MKAKDEKKTKTNSGVMNSSNGSELVDEGLESLVNRVEKLIKGIPKSGRKMDEDTKFIIIFGLLILNGFVAYLLLSLMQ